jgi:hypothetical protein
MDTVVLSRCMKCNLEWVYDPAKEHCPACRAHSNIPKYPVIVAGRSVTVKAVVLHGGDMGLQDKAVRKGLDKLYLMERCPCGYITYRICPKCYLTRVE